MYFIADCFLNFYLLPFLILMLICLIINFLLSSFYGEALWFPEGVRKCYGNAASFIHSFIHYKHVVRFFKPLLVCWLIPGCCSVCHVHFSQFWLLSLIKSSSLASLAVAPDTINNHVKTCPEEQKNLHFFAPEYGGKRHNKAPFYLDSYCFDLTHMTVDPCAAAV